MAIRPYEICILLLVGARFIAPLESPNGMDFKMPQSGAVNLGAMNGAPTECLAVVG